MLRPMRDEWDMYFTQSGPEALDILGSENCEVIVTDLCMPGMDGVQVLKQTQQSFPDTIRMVLSGQADQKAIWNAIGLAQNYLAKPCDGRTVKKAITQALNMRRFLTCTPLRNIVAQLEFLPVLPEIYDALRAEIDSPSPDIHKAAMLTGLDSGIMTKLLQVANSALFGKPKQISDPEEAALSLGVEGIKALLDCYQSLSHRGDTHILKSRHESIARNSIRMAHICREIVGERTRSIARRTEAYTTGIIHSAGELVLAAYFPEEYERCRSLSRQNKIPIWRVEREIFQVTHAEAGAFLTGLWGLPAAIVEALTYHHTPIESDLKDNSLLTAVHVAEYLAYEYDEQEDGVACEPDYEYLNRIGEVEHLHKWQEMFNNYIESLVTGNE